MKKYEINYCFPFYGTVYLSATSKEEAITQFQNMPRGEIFDYCHNEEDPVFCENCDITEISEN
jgi:hypothetical protein